METLGKDFEKLSFHEDSKLIAPVVENVSPWVLEEQGLTLSKWCLHKNHIYVGLQLKRLLGPKYKLLSENSKRWECRYKGPDRKKMYQKYIKKKLWHHLGSLSGKKLGCYCYEYEHCHCKELVKLFKRKYKIIN